MILEIGRWTLDASRRCLMRITCHTCNKELQIDDKVGFREICPYCSAYLHSCVHCRLWDLKNGNCAEPQAEKVRDPEAGNFCEYFIARESTGPGSEDSDRNEAEDLWKKLMGKS